MTVQLHGGWPPREPNFELRAGGLRVSLERETWQRLKAWLYGLLVAAAAAALAAASALAGTYLQ